MIYAVVNQKGGVGKTTTAINLGAYLASEGKRILLVDLDPQGNATSGVGIDTEQIQSTIYEVLAGQETIVNAIHPTAVDNLHILPSNANLAAIEVELAADEERSVYLKKLIANVHEVYDYVIIDCPPALSILTINALTASERVIIPLQCEYFALEGLARLLRTLQMVQKGLNPELKMEGILLTMFDQRTTLSYDVEKEARKHFGEKIFDTFIPRNIRLAEAPSHGLPIIFYAPESKGALAYKNLAKEIMIK
ncbi:MAG: ParA family protein [Candidatus Margulisiibacteriota bacterium]|jgi:chromosome partitioning protein